MRISVHVRYSAVLIGAVCIFALGFFLGYSAGHRDGASTVKVDPIFKTP